jgi:hypothetical protein
MNIKLWYCEGMKQWRWTLTDNSRPICKQESGQQPHLRDAMIVNDINNLTNQLTVKKELALKLQGIIEYLDQIGVTLPDEDEEETEEES